MMNPYVVASIRKMRADRSLRLPAAIIGVDVAMTSQATAFLDATMINHGGNRARICTAIAHTLSDDELVSVLVFYRNQRNKRVMVLREHSAPQVVIDNVLRVTPGEAILVRLAGKRGIVV